MVQQLQLLDRLNIVPNPYYAYSQYENSRLDTRVKIINLPQSASIKIYTVDGTLIKTINKADAGSTSVEWDVKNDKGVPVASGMYLVHIKIKTDQGEKEKVLKWFGIMRPLDITNF
jgi:flagellar hook assembly protein FlgD